MIRVRNPDIQILIFAHLEKLLDFSNFQLKVKIESQLLMIKIDFLKVPELKFIL